MLAHVLFLAALGYGKGKSLSNAIANHVDPEDKGVTELMTPGGMQKMIIINESGLYSLILSSKLPGAKKFRIRTGRALTRPTQNIIQKLHQVFQRGTALKLYPQLFFFSNF